MPLHSSTAGFIELAMLPIDVADALRHLPNMVFFDSAGNLPSRSHAAISIIAARPREILSGNVYDESDMAQLRMTLSSYQSHLPSTGFPVGGACGWIDYDGCYCFGIYPEMLIYHHDRQQWWECGTLSQSICLDSSNEHLHENDPLMMNPFEASTSQGDYLSGIRRIQEYISAGDIYQVNLTQKFSSTVSGGSLFSLYRELRTMTPAPLAAWIDLGGREILSSSPETFLKMSGRNIETRPIKGTRPRGATKAEDLSLARELMDSAKEKAELTMITDLERNDLGKVCEFGTVRVAEMLALETLEQVYHLVSTVTGTLREEVDHLSALTACFPGGSITGAPKRRAMEIISELEPLPRGLYTGAMGYLGFNGESQMNIPIRTLVREGDSLHYHVGAGIVADSNPEAEYQETLDKAKGIRMALSAITHSL